MKSDDIVGLTSTQGLIVNALCQAIADLGGDRGLLSILGSWGDTLPDSEILDMLIRYNAATSAERQRPPNQYTIPAVSAPHQSQCATHRRES
jgi:hypothetical protein